MKTYEYLDNEIVKRFISGDNQAFEEVYNYYQLYVYRLAYQFFNNEETAKDIVQDTFIKAFKRREQLKNSEAILTWLHRICYSTCLDEYKKKQVDSTGHTDDGVSERIEVIQGQKEQDLIDQVHLSEAKEAVVDIIEGMKPELKTIAYLRFFEELKHKEIAEITGIEITSIGVYIKRIKEQIVQKLGERGYNKKSCLSIVVTPFLIDFYKEFVNSFPKIPQTLNPLINDNVSKKKRKIKKSEVRYSQLFIATTLVVAGGAVAMNNEDIKNKIIPETTAYITNVTYNDSLTNQPIKVSVETSDDQYDHILIDKKETLTIEENGDYAVEMIKKGEVIDTYKISITNIDRDIPKVINEKYDGNKVVLTLEDKDSGIDYSKIELYENGVKTSLIEINQSNATITIKKDLEKDSLLKVSDLAGNVLNVTVNFY